MNPLRALWHRLAEPLFVIPKDTPESVAEWRHRMETDDPATEPPEEE